MNSNSPYQAPQADLTSQADLTPQPDLKPQRETFSRVLPAIVGVGATITFWVYLSRSLIMVITTVIAHLDLNYESDGLYGLLKGLEFWVVPSLIALGIFLLSLVQEETDAKSSFKLSWVLILMFWAWSIVVMFEKNPESIPASVRWVANQIGLVYALALSWGCWRLSKFCQDSQMKRWSFFAMTLGSCSYLLTAFHGGCDVYGPEIARKLTEAQFQILAQVYYWLYFVHWAVWLPVAYCISRALWRINAHAEIEAQKNVQSPASTELTELPRDTE